MTGTPTPNAFPRADLHIHTRCSDGSLSPSEILQTARDAGITAVAFTDHDSLGAYDELASLAIPSDITLVTGIELSASHRKEGIHILGYGFALADPTLRQLCHDHAARRQERNAAILELLAQQQIPLTMEELRRLVPHTANGGTPFSRLHIAQLLVHKGYCRTVAEAFHRHLGERGSAYVDGFPISPEEIIDILHRAGGYAVLAHPMLIARRSTRRDLLAMPFDGLEAFYSRASREQQRSWEHVAREKHWMSTGGSDFHGEAKPYIRLGCSWTPETDFQLILQRSLGNNGRG